MGHIRVKNKIFAGDFFSLAPVGDKISVCFQIVEFSQRRFRVEIGELEKARRVGISLGQLGPGQDRTSRN